MIACFLSVFLHPFYLFLVIAATISSLMLVIPDILLLFPVWKAELSTFHRKDARSFYRTPSLQYIIEVVSIPILLKIVFKTNFLNIATKSFEMIFHLKFFFFRYSFAKLYQLTLWCHTCFVLFGGKSTTWSWYNTPSCITGFHLLVIFVKFLHWFIWVRLTYASLSHRLLVFSVKIMLFS